jgi:hypothetical protein
MNGPVERIFGTEGAPKLCVSHEGRAWRAWIDISTKKEIHVRGPGETMPYEKMNFDMSL